MPTNNMTETPKDTAQLCATRRLMKDYAEVMRNPLTNVVAEPLEDDLFRWHCNVRQPEGDGVFECHVPHRVAIRSALPDLDATHLTLHASAASERATDRRRWRQWVEARSLGLHPIVEGLELGLHRPVDPRAASGLSPRR